MARCTTRYFGETEYDTTAVIRFPGGLPGFEGERDFLPLEQPEQRPLVFLQSLATPDLCFVALPALAIDSTYRLEMNAADRELVGLPPDGEIRIGEQVACLALLTIDEGCVTANLLAPLVVDLRQQVGVQAIAPEMHYSHQTPVGEPACSS